MKKSLIVKTIYTKRNSNSLTKKTIIMYSKTDIKYLKSKNISQEEVDKQLSSFENGFEYIKLVSPATTRNGIIKFNDKDIENLISLYDEAVKKLDVIKFVPASGSATRMFKTLFEFLNTYDGKEDSFLNIIKDKKNDSINNFFNSISEFPFYGKLSGKIWQNGESIDLMIKKKRFKDIIEYLLTEKGLNYGATPKGLIDFHIYSESLRTAFDEQIEEAIRLCYNGKKTNIHFTVSEEHLDDFKNRLDKLNKGSNKLKEAKVNVTFSLQKNATDTISVDTNGEIVRDNEGNILLRPGGHGALIHNLNELKEHIIFIKNIDNILPDRGKEISVKYKKIIAGHLIKTRILISRHIKQLISSNVTDKDIQSAKRFISKLGIKFENYPNFKNLKAEGKYLKDILNRPIRVCGMVENKGEPGGGPFWAISKDGNQRLMIVESAQVNKSDSQQNKIFEKSTHFNPVDIACCIEDYKGRKFNLKEFIDETQGFISEKSYLGKEIKCLELPGLWNGAMANWITIFVEVPEDTFAPVKTVFDLLRFEHKNIIKRN